MAEGDGRGIQIPEELFLVSSANVDRRLVEQSPETPARAVNQRLKAVVDGVEPERRRLAGALPVPESTTDPVEVGLASGLFYIV